ncbi:hypothetical protein GCM10023203_10250 [Actinomycetospora straminea]|uniref:Uncharacterized protein n=1 Tax=Actinomycetospora straminea TaxID=663607 RepID=A0ABP9E367_9PSEU
MATSTLWWVLGAVVLWFVVGAVVALVVARVLANVEAAEVGSSRAHGWPGESEGPAVPAPRDGAHDEAEEAAHRRSRGQAPTEG